MKKKIVDKFRNSTLNFVDSSQRTAMSDDELKKVQFTLLEILDDISSFCDDNNIKYSLCGGTALGAVRHHGFIPWDDDADICMPRDDYDRFIQLFSEKYSDRYDIETPEQTEDQFVLEGRVYKKGTVFRRYENYSSKNTGIAVDVFPIENVSDNLLMRVWHGGLSFLIRIAISSGTFFMGREGIEQILEDSKELKPIYRVKLFIGKIVSKKPSAYWNKKEYRIFSMCRDKNSKYMTIPTGTGLFFGEMLPRKVFEETEIACFEDRQYRVMKYSDEYLRNLYGDYMQLPPLEERKRHFIYELKL